MNDIQYPLKGTCQCGSITYQLAEAPIKVMACHCRQCQKLSTSAFSITALVKASALTITGELKFWERQADSGNTNGAAFCPNCGNRIYHYNPADPEHIKLKPSTLQDTRVIQPTMHVWVSEKQDWFVIPDGVDVHQQQP